MKGGTEREDTNPESYAQGREPTHAVPVLPAERCCLLVDLGLDKFIILNTSDFQH